MLQSRFNTITWSHREKNRARNRHESTQKRSEVGSTDTHKTQSGWVSMFVESTESLGLSNADCTPMSEMLLTDLRRLIGEKRN